VKRSEAVFGCALPRRAVVRWWDFEHYRGLCVFAPPPHIVSIHERQPVWHELPWHVDRRLAAWPLLGSIGQHFLIAMRKR